LKEFQREFIARTKIVVDLHLKIQNSGILFYPAFDYQQKVLGFAVGGLFAFIHFSIFIPKFFNRWFSDNLSVTNLC